MEHTESPLVQLLLVTREAVERLVALLTAESDLWMENERRLLCGTAAYGEPDRRQSLSASDLKRLYHGRTAARKLNDRYILWALSPTHTVEESAEVMRWVAWVWRILSLDRYADE